MVENQRWLNVLAHAVLILGVLVVALPVYIALVASTHESGVFLSGVIPMLPGRNMVETYSAVLRGGLSSQMSQPIWLMLGNSMIMAMMIAVGKIVISITSAFAIVYFRFPFRGLAFWMIFITLMLPVEVRILPTYKVIADLGMLNSYAGLSIPLIASATATFLFRQVFLTMPDELVEAARIDGAGPMKFFRDILLPLSRTNIAALFVILFIYGWNQYLWPLLVTTDPSYTTIVAGIKRMTDVADGTPQWNYIMAVAMLAMLPPVAVVVFMQRLFVKGLIETEK
ncbi:sn-glycerol-3-phosphate ABC transporter permease UgpE [Pseudooceanicola sediminis]|uniref:sn-glycerol-3-phosphate transport system permease protein UgpE n=1 Tax=Pseudooceanicola sediminis TaxID=2211117 RepID=A0A399IYM6_9RHOB|nr:sn-glycerol-3-phosphate ABC transporter permease UgpE [Pseudooceanicola sediminis]KAA2313433.1 sn-glycerol-3-phosphate ABC transporter permease UgpE [Puniceibacterium sp. HSS470]RII38288.1 sn-glycerol-3-phosphate ABC transporter permease UgpE [Pseudooceanicola sediminis]|tara:strand:- start:15905 stop:16753 length:849 start_codon:yes stop_codon:yes gene_type:complete